MQVAEPVPLLGELQSPLTEVVARGELDPDADLRERGEERERPGRDVVERQHPDDERGGEREDDQRGRHRTATKTTAMTARLEAIASAYVRTSPVWRREKARPTSTDPSASPRPLPAIRGRSTRRPRSCETRTAGR